MVFFVRSLFAYAGAAAWITLGLMIVLGLTQGIGLAMIIPFLHIIGLASSGTSQYAQGFSKGMDALGLSPNFLSVILAYLTIICLHAAAQRFNDILVIKIGAGYAQHLRNRLYDRMCRADWLSFLSIPNPDIVHVMTGDINQVAFGTQRIIQAAAICIRVLIYTGFSFVLSWPMTLVVLGCGSLFLLLFYPLNRKAVDYGNGLWQARNTMVSMITEHITGMKVLRSYGLEAAQQKSFQDTSRAMTEQIVSFNRLSATSRAWYRAGAAGAIAACLSVGVMVLSLPPVDLMLIIFLFSRILPGLSEIQLAMQRFVNALPSFRAVLAMEKKLIPDRAGQIQEASGTVLLEKAIEFDSVWFRYDKTEDSWTLEDLSFTIPAGKITAIAGHSGAGKTSIADLILGLFPPEKGIIRIDGEALATGHLNAWRQGVGYVPQETFLFSDSIGENLKKVSPEASDSQIWSALKKAAAAQFVTALPRGLDTIVGDNGIRLSGGERQRLALARALLRSPQLLILDEATSALDRENQTLIQEALEQLKGRMTIVIIAHRFSTIKRADHVITLDNGRLL